MRSTRCLLFSLLVFLQVQSADAQDTHVETPPAIIHLAGHEEAELLQRVQDVIDDWDPNKLVNPYVITSAAQDENGESFVRKSLRRPDLMEFVADVEAVEALGKAFFWEMRSGSDFRRTEDSQFVGTACATCHYRNGADARDRHTERIPYVVWDQYKLHPEHPFVFGETQLPFDPVLSATRVSSPSDKTPYSLIVGSQGVERKQFLALRADPPVNSSGEWNSEESLPMANGVKDPGGTKKDWQMFYEGHDPLKRAFRQITNRNSPTVINAGFADRLFHDGRAESTFNGFSIFGDFDEKEVIYRAGSNGPPVSVHIAILQAALASQAVGPIVNEIEMSYEGRTFVDLARKLLDAKILEHQTQSPNDEVLSRFANYVATDGKTYRDLIKRAFRREWWDSQDAVPLQLSRNEGEVGSIMEANFSLYWGLAILIYESELISKSSPFDAMMVGNPEPVNDKWEREKANIEPVYLDRAQTDHPEPIGSAPPKHTTGTAVFQHGFRVYMNRGCIECHSGPLFSEIYNRIPEVENRLPIAKDVHRTLLPLAKSDSIAQQSRLFHERVLQQVADVISTSVPSLRIKAAGIALSLDALRNDARGNEAILGELIFNHLDGLGVSLDQAKSLAK
ncbi:MAG: cytochrome-c peroxidase, partial [Aureliella sp.]